MKKVIFGLMALAIGLFSSCSNDEIPVDAPEAPVQDAVTITVDLSDFYANYNYDDTKHDVQIAEMYRTFHSENNKYIHVRTYFYDRSSDELVDSIVKYVTTTNSLSTTVSLPKGNYYAISSVCFADNMSAKASWWQIQDRERLSTAKLWYGPYGSGMWSILSMSVDAFTVSKGSHETINTTPRPLGALVYCVFENFQYLNEATYGTLADNHIREMGLLTQRRAVSYNLDPNATSFFNYREEGGSNSYYIDVWVESETSFTQNYARICYILEPQQHIVFGYIEDGVDVFSGYGEQDVTYKSGTTYLAYWDYFKVGNPYFGVADNNHWNTYTKPEPTPTVDELFESPYLGWGDSKTTVRSKVEAMGFTFAAEGENYLYFEPVFKEDWNYYGFDSDALNFIIINFTPSNVSLDELNSYVANLSGVEFYFTSDAGDNYYTTSDPNTYMMVYEATDDDGTKSNRIEYFYYSSSSTSRARIVEKAKRIASSVKSIK